MSASNWRAMHSFTRDRAITHQQLKPGTIRRIASYARPYRLWLILFLFMTSLDAVVTVAIPLLLRELIDKGVEVHCQARHAENWEVDELIQYLSAYFPIPPGSQFPSEVLAKGTVALADTIHESAMGAYQAKEDQIGAELMRTIERWVMLKTIDSKWVDYLTQMEHFREGIGLRAYGQKDPLVEYKNEAFTMFQELTASIQADIVGNMFRVQVTQDPPPPPEPPRGIERGPGGPEEGSPLAPNGSGGNGHGGARTPVAAGGVPSSGKVGRNDPCPCGSGKKYKRCHGR